MTKTILSILTLFVSFTILTAGNTPHYAESTCINEEDSKPVDVENSTVAWVGKKVTGQHSGTINIQSGNIEFADGKAVGGSFVIDMTSITVTDLESGSGKEKLEGHLKADDFFGVEQHASSTLTITNISSVGDDSYEVQADVTIKGITHPTSFTATITNSSAVADIVIDRTLYDVKYGSTKFGALADKAIYDEFQLSVNLKF